LLKKKIFAYTVLVLAVLCSISFAGEYKVLRVVDGDTIDIDYNGHKERVRLLCVNTPESVHPTHAKNTPMGKTASLYTKKKLTGKTVDLKFEGKKQRGRYNRLLAYVFVDGHNFNVDLVKKGLSPYYTRYGASKAYDQEFTKAEQRAKKQHLNIWSQKSGNTTRSPGLTAALDTNIFHGNIDSKIFHNPGCRYYNGKNCTRIFHSKTEARQAGFRPCKICRP
jgi:micrococcal nuclease